MEGGSAAPRLLGGGHGAAAASLRRQRSGDAMASQDLLLPLLLQLLFLHLLQLLSGLHFSQLFTLLTHLLGERETDAERSGQKAKKQSGTR